MSDGFSVGPARRFRHGPTSRVRTSMVVLALPEWSDGRRRAPAIAGRRGRKALPARETRRWPTARHCRDAQKTTGTVLAANSAHVAWRRCTRRGR